jgi:opacity protein-like surface antigen
MRTPLAKLSVLTAAVTALVATAPLGAQSAHSPLHVDPTLEDCSVRFAPTLTQGAFHRFVREFGSVSAFKQVASPGALGKGRVLVGVEMMRFQVDHRSDAWNDTFSHPDADHPLGATQSFPKLKLRVGVSDALDVGAFYTENLSANYGWLGLDAKYALLTERDDRPVSLAVRGAYTKTLHVGDMDMHALTADVSVGRRFWRGLKAYAGLGADGVLVRETSAAVDLRGERIVAPHLFGGVDAALGQRVSVGAEFTVGPRPSVQVQVGGVAFQGARRARTPDRAGGAAGPGGTGS